MTQKRTLAHRLDNKRCRLLWWMHRNALAICVLSGAIGLLAAVLAVLDVATGPRRAIMGWDDLLIMLAIMIVSSLITAATAPKPKDAAVIESTVPVVKDGQGIRRVYGTVWIDDSIVLGWQQLGADPIKSDGGKK